MILATITAAALLIPAAVDPGPAPTAPGGWRTGIVSSGIYPAAEGMHPALLADSWNKCAADVDRDFAETYDRWNPDVTRTVKTPCHYETRNGRRALVETVTVWVSPDIHGIVDALR